MKSATQLIDDIESKSKGLYANLDDSEHISKTLFELAILAMGLGNFLIEALDNERMAESTYKSQLDQRVRMGIQEGEAVNKSELKARQESLGEMSKWLKAKRNVDVLKIKRADLDKVIDTGRSRLSLIKNDIRQGGN